ncbi:MFS transporter [Bradyrhizobium sp. LHD-71]|uniref:MFS transporter n=1 Tax=Bradyrhizobium sp. LHD-71 TaxID=3072141 RepID=UPI00280D6994|nr:MFS transporter [Bradyrhizobium sp. LHD-71]MDQ8727114.1 MFS transporter [Bradyrhizobium sp. LHD-71]
MLKPYSEPVAATSERSLSYDGWRVVFACFMVAIFSWGLGFYGHGVYLAELQRAKGWPTSLISTATTAYYLCGALLVVYVSDILQRLGPRTMLIAGATFFSVAVAGIAYVSEPWQLFAAYAVMAIGWMLASAGALTNVAGLWFFEKRGLAISLALTGASFGGIILTPLMVAAVSQWGFRNAMLGTAAATFALLITIILICVGRPPKLAGAAASGAPSAQSSGETWTRPRALRSLQFWTMTLPFALGIGAQVGFLVHQIAFLEPKIGLQTASYAVAVTTAVAVLGRLVVGAVIDRLNQRVLSAASFVSQALALLVLINTDSHAAIFLACALFGFSVGNLITLPSLIIFREFGAKSFGLLVGLSVAINQVIYAFGPGVVGWLRDFSGTYTASFIFCMALQCLAAVIILIPFRKAA